MVHYFYKLGARLAIALLLPIKSFAIFYAIFTPLTVLLSLYAINLFYSAELMPGTSIILVKNIMIEIVRSCVAGSAYYLLAILNLLTKGISLIDRIKIFILNALALLLLNITRITILTIVLIEYGKDYFNAIHTIFWVILSTLFVFLIWIITIKAFKIKTIPIYSDIQDVLAIIKNSK